MKQLTILVCPINAVGHVNACIGTTSSLVKRGHRVIFVVESNWSGKLTGPHGVIEHLYTGPLQMGKNTAAHLAEVLLQNDLIGNFSPKEKSLGCLKFLESDHVRAEWQVYNAAIKEAIQLYKPDVIITDENGLMPAIYWSGVPWIRHFSCNPLFFILDDELPPGGSGLPFDDRTGWAEFNKLRHDYIYSDTFNDYLESVLGYSRYPNNLRTPPTQSLIIYATPEEWNYPPLRTRSDWFNLEVFNKKPATTKRLPLEAILPREFLEDTLDGTFSGKLVYVSMGSMGSVDLELMSRLLKVLAKLPHKFIISKGPRAEAYQVEGRNQWGDRYLPQIDLLPQVDAVITHGGNNSVTEIFAQGKPMLVMPLFADQFDNAQRLHETGYALKMDPYNFTDTEMIEAINRLLTDEPLKNKLQAASKRIQSTDRHEQLAICVEELVASEKQKRKKVQNGN